MSLNAIFNNANTGLAAAQQQLRVVSDNVANVNTPGYVRKIADQVSVTNQGIGAGVDIARVRLATDRFLQAASLNAGAEAGRQGVRYELYDRIQSLFGDPGGDSGFFTRIDDIFNAFAATADDPTSGPRRQEAIFQAQSVLDEAARISGQIQATRADADARLSSAVAKVNGLLTQIDDLNTEIARSNAVGTDASGAQGAQQKLIAELGGLLDIRVTPLSSGGVSIRTGAGALLAGPGAATLEYQRAGNVGPETTFNDVWITEPAGQKRSLTDLLSTGEMKGLIELRDVEAPETAERLAELTTRMVDELNRAHNANSAVPPPQTLTGRNIGQALETAIAGFTGRTTVAVTNAQGVIQSRADIDFTAMTINGAAFTPATFLTGLNAAVGPQATASFTDGRLSLTATNGNGVSIGDDAAAPSQKTGRGFSHFFGLNDLVVADRPALFETGLAAGDPHGFTAGETVKFRLSTSDGKRLRDVSFTLPAGVTTVGQLRDALNDPSTGIGRFGSFTLDGQGALIFTGSGNPAARLEAFEDTTTQVPSGVSMSELFGFGSGARASRADSFSIRQDIHLNPSRLALAQLQTGAAAGSPALLTGDNRGVAGLANAGNRPAAFQGAGGAAAALQTVSRYASELSGDIGGRASAAKTRAESATAIQDEAVGRQTAFEGVNLDEELVLMTTYQQAFNASARLIQSAREMYDTLLGMV